MFTWSHVEGTLSHDGHVQVVNNGHLVARPADRLITVLYTSVYVYVQVVNYGHRVARPADQLITVLNSNIYIQCAG